VTPTADSPADRLVLEAVGVALSALPASVRIAVAFSGGVDSSVLLDAAVRVAGASRCVALHVHHGLSATPTSGSRTAKRLHGNVVSNSRRSASRCRVTRA
jgi:asparagine synthetase B (glutamine-hydrolysing)